MPAQLWGCYSVADHKAADAFVADVLLYERLVVPVPPDGDGSDWDPEWEPDRQARLLEIIGDVAKRIPWTPERRAAWRQEWSAAQAADELVGPMHLTRGLISREIGDRARGRADVRAVPVYADPVSFDASWKVRLALPFVRRTRRVRPISADDKPEVPEGSLPPGHDELAKFLVAKLAVPAEGATHEEKLKRAVDFAAQSHVAVWRSGFHAWLVNIASEGISDERIAREAGQQVDAWNRKVKRKFKHTVVRHSGTVVGGATGIAAALWGGPLGPATKAPVAAVGNVVADRVFGEESGDQIPAGALLAEASRRLSPKRRFGPS